MGQMPPSDSGRGQLKADPSPDQWEQIRTVVETMSVPVTRCSRDLTYLWVNQPYADLRGRRIDEIVGRPIIDLIGADAFEAIRPYVDRVLSGERTEYEACIPFPGLGWRWVHAVYTPTFDSDRSPDGWVAVVTDIDERRRVEEALRVSERDVRQLAAIVESSDDAIISKDLKSIVTSWNRAAERMFSYSAAEAIGQSIRLIIPNERQEEEHFVLERIRRGETIEHFETVRRRKDGTLVPISLTVSPVRDTSGQVVGASKIARDISEHKRAEEAADRATLRTKFLLQASTALTQSLDYEQALKTLAHLAVPQIADWCAVDLVDAGGRLAPLAMAHVDPHRAAEMCRQWSESPSAGAALSHVVRTGDTCLVPRITDDLSGISDRCDPGPPTRVSQRVGVVDEACFQLTHELGVVSYLCVPIAARGRVLGALTLLTAESGRQYTDQDRIFAEDLAARAALAVEHTQAYEQLGTANRLKDEFLATLSHELRTPLNAVLGYARMLRSGSLPADRITLAFEVIERNATALTQIVEDLLDVSRIISGKTRIHVQSVDLPRVLREAVATVAPAAEAKGLRIQTAIDTHSGPISGDPDRLQQVAWNLLSNAVKFTPKGGAVQLRLERLHSHVEIVVSDTGVGVDPEFLPHIFDRFRQAEGSITRRHSGLGLGLAITRHLVELHGGTIDAASDGLGTGTTVRVRLPVIIVHAEAPREEPRVHPRVEPPKVLASIPDLNGVHVLAVDDDEDVLGLLRAILQTSGARVTTASSGHAALHTLGTARPDVLVADLGMPVMDGYRLIARIRDLSDPALRAIPAAALTAYARSEDRAKALLSGFEIHLAKPVDPVELVAAVTALARRRASPSH